MASSRTYPSGRNKKIAAISLIICPFSTRRMDNVGPSFCTSVTTSFRKGSFCLACRSLAISCLSSFSPTFKPFTSSLVTSPLRKEVIPPLMLKSPFCTYQFLHLILSLRFYFKFWLIFLRWLDFLRIHFHNYLRNDLRRHHSTSLPHQILFSMVISITVLCWLTEFSFFKFFSFLT